MKIQALLSRGYLPKELPPIFTSRRFARIATSLPSVGANYRSYPTAVNLVRPGSVVRRLGIPNPLSQYNLARVCEKYWKEIEAHLGKSDLSLSRPVKGGPFQRAAIVEKGFDEQIIERVRRLAPCRYTLVSDISECYASIYSHSIEWALIGKPAAKLAMSNRSSKKSYGAKLDKAVANSQDGQTKGIPIGPDTSLIVAEIVLASIDVTLQEKHSNLSNRCFRVMDDIEYYCRTYDEAEKMLLDWQVALSKMELSVNPAKTVIIDGPPVLEPLWRIELAKFASDLEESTALSKDFPGFFHTAFEAAKANPRESVLSYTVSAAGQIMKNGDQGDWDIVCPLMLAAAINDPTCLEYLAEALDLAKTSGWIVDRESVELSLNVIAADHALRQHGTVVTWCLWMLYKLDLFLHKESADAIVEMADNCCLLLLSLLNEESKILSDGIDLSSAISRAEAADVLSSEDWLIAYELALQGLASDSEIMKDDNWKHMFESDVSFLNKAYPVLGRPGGSIATRPANRYRLK